MAESSDFRALFKEAVRILSGGQPGYAGDHALRTVQVKQATVDRFRAALSASDSGEVAGLREVYREGLVSALAYALSRADPKMDHTETSLGYAERLAPLVIESGWLTTPPAPTPASEDGLRGHVPDALVVALAERHLDDGSPCFCPDYIVGYKSPFSTMDSEHSDYCERVRAALAATTERPAEPTGEPS